MPFNLNNEWKPTKKQAQFLAVPFSIREAFYGGGAGSGKSELLLMFPIVHGFHQNPKFKQLFLRRTSKQLKKEVWSRAFEIYPKFGAVPNESDMVWTFPREEQFGTGVKPTGAKIFFGHCENENDVHIYDSMEINLFTPDEVTSLTYPIYSYIGFSRGRSSDPLLPAAIRGAGMPGDIGHSWVKSRFVTPAPEGGKRIIGKSGNSRIYIHATVLDNLNADPNYISNLRNLPEAEYKAKMGDWDSYLGQVFEEFRDVQYEDEPDNALHICKPFDIPSWWPRIVSIDWGHAAMCSIGWGAISPNQRLYVYRHQYWYGKKISEWAPEVKFFIDKDQPSDIVICHSANQHRGDPNTILEQVSEALGVSIRLGEKNRLAGKTLLHEYLRWNQKVTLTAEQTGKFDHTVAEWILRNKGRKDYDEYLAVYNQQNIVEDIPRIQFFDNRDVKLICDAIKMCVYENDTSDGKKKEDVKEFNGDDPYDMLRMLLHSADMFFGTATETSVKLNKTAEVIDRFNNTGDMTQFYRNMRKLDNESEELVVAIPRFGARGRRGHVVH